MGVAKFIQASPSPTASTPASKFALTQTLLTLLEKDNKPSEVMLGKYDRLTGLYSQYKENKVTGIYNTKNHIKELHIEVLTNKATKKQEMDKEKRKGVFKNQSVAEDDEGHDVVNERTKQHIEISQTSHTNRINIRSYFIY